jgi:hypothetical protein
MDFGADYDSTHQDLALPCQRLSVFILQIIVSTSDVSGAGTDANVWVVLHGQDSNKTPKLVLSAKGRNCFERGQKEEFLVTWGSCVDGKQRGWCKSQNFPTTTTTKTQFDAAMLFNKPGAAALNHTL